MHFDAAIFIAFKAIFSAVNPSISNKALAAPIYKYNKKFNQIKKNYQTFSERPS